jgi:cytochrome c peroxidase
MFMTRFHQSRRARWLAVAAVAVALVATAVCHVSSPAAEGPKKPPEASPPAGASSYDQITPLLLGQETFRARLDKDRAEKPAVTARQKALLDARYDLSRRPHPTQTMSRGKPVPVGPTARLPAGMTWEKLAALSPEEVREKGLFPAGFLPLPHPKHAAGGMVFPQAQLKQFARLERFDVEFDLPDPFLPEFPPAMYLTTRPDLGDVSRGQVVTAENLHELFAGVLNPKQLEGLRLLVTQFPQQQFNGTADRKTLSADGMRGVACFDCHVNGHTSGATHEAGDVRPQSHRRRIDTVTLRGLYAQRLFGSQRAMRTVEDFTQFEQRGAYFDGDHVAAAAKGVNPLERGSQVHFMAEMQEILDFPPAPALGWDGKLDPRKFAPDSPEMRGQALFFGKARCAECHPAPFYTDNTMHDLKVERFYKAQTVNGLVATAQGPIKTFPLRGIKDSPPYLHDGRLLTLEDAVEFFNIVLERQLTAAEKADLVAFLLRL